jgi:hypothetical protein
MASEHLTAISVWTAIYFEHEHPAISQTFLLDLDLRAERRRILVQIYTLSIDNNPPTIRRLCLELSPYYGLSPSDLD